jgi:uncharacterized protein YndB with AHSA1/START domain
MASREAILMSEVVVVRASRRFSASSERVFDAWLDANSMRKWLFATPDGEMMGAESDGRVGGRFLFTERRGGVDVDHVGEYLEIDRPRRLVFTFTVPMFSPQATRVTVEITPTDEGCALALTHEGVFEDYEAQTRKGWTGILEGLAGTLT